MRNRVLYFAYGQNMNPQCMKGCCPHAKAVCAATLKNYRLTERRFADIDPDSASEVHGVLYSITPGDKKKLDLYARYLGGFAETEVEVVFGDEAFTALTYMMTPEGKRKCDGIPFEYSYLRQCRSGAAHYLVPNSFRYANVIVYGTRMTGEKDDTFYKNAVVIKPCTITGTLYDSGYGYPIFSPEGNTLVEAEYLRVPRTLWEYVLGYLEESPFKPGFLVGTAPDGSTFGGWSVCLDVMPPRAKVIESGSWRARRKLKYDSLVFFINGEGYDAHLMIDFANDALFGKIVSLSPDDPDEIESEGAGHLGRYWRKEIRNLLRECQFERWQEACYSNGDCRMRWLLELKYKGKRVRFMSGQNILPMNWEVFKNVVRLCLRLCNMAGAPDGTSDDGESAAGNESATPTAAAQNDAAFKNETDPMVEIELPLFDDDALHARTETAPDESREHDAADGALYPEPPSDPNDVDGWFYYVLENPDGMDRRDCPSERFTLEQWKELILTWPMLLQYDPPEELRDILSRDDFKSWTGYQVCEALFMDGQWLADLFPMDHITQEDFDACFGADAFEGPEDYWDVIPGYFPFGIPPQIKLPFPPPDGTERG